MIVTGSRVNLSAAMIIWAPLMKAMPPIAFSKIFGDTVGTISSRKRVTHRSNCLAPDPPLARLTIGVDDKCREIWQ